LIIGVLVLGSHENACAIDLDFLRFLRKRAKALLDELQQECEATVSS
jgi:hypothetical protein